MGVTNIPVMSHYSFAIRNDRGRAQYPRNFELPDIDAARLAALRIARIFVEVVPYWKQLTPDQRNDFVVEIMDEAGQTILTVPFSDVAQSMS
jgi:hypothetical protein